MEEYSLGYTVPRIYIYIYSLCIDRGQDRVFYLLYQYIEIVIVLVHQTFFVVSDPWERRAARQFHC